MLLQLIVCCLTMTPTTDIHAGQPGLTLDDVQQKLDQQRSMIRMCGPLSVLRMCALQSKPVDVQATLAAYRCKRSQGISVREVLQLSRKLGLTARGVRFDRRSLQDLPTPCIILINQDHHCVVLESVSASNETAKVWDPAQLRTKDFDVDLLSELWSGHAITFSRHPATQLLIDVANVAAIALTIVLLVCVRRSSGKKSQPSVTEQFD